MSAFLTKPSIGKQYVQEIRSVAAKHRTIVDEDLLEELKEAFQIFDTSHKGSVDLREFKAAMRALGCQGVSKHACMDMFREVDKDPASTINFEEFCKLLSPKMNAKDIRSEAQMVFQLFDSDKTGSITFKNLKKVCQEVGEDFTDKELHAMISEADRSGDGSVQFSEFFKIMKKKCNDPLNEFDSD